MSLTFTGPEESCETGVVSEMSSSPAPMPANPDWGDWRSVAKWWFQPVVDPRTWAAAGYLTVGLFASVVWFTVTIAVLSVSLPLLIIALGFPLSWLAFGAVNAMAGVERRRALWLGLSIEPRPLRQAFVGKERFWGRLFDPARWRQASFLLSGFFVVTMFFTISVVSWALTANFVLGIIFGQALSTLVLQLAFAGVMAGVAPRITVLLALAYARLTRWFLGPDPVLAMAHRVETLSKHRQEILDAVTEERRRIERNLHDGVQQRLVALGIDLGLAASKLPEDAVAAKELVEAAREKTRTSIGELRVIGRGLHPAILGDRGLDAALSAVVSNAKVPISLSIPEGLRLPLDIEETAYFLASEAISNIMKHSDARAASIRIDDDGRRLTILILDDGGGGADMTKGTGLAGMAARVRATDGTFDLRSPSGGPTSLNVELPYA